MKLTKGSHPDYIKNYTDKPFKTRKSCKPTIMEKNENNLKKNPGKRLKQALCEEGYANNTIGL